MWKRSSINIATTSFKEVEHLSFLVCPIILSVIQFEKT